MYSDTFVYNYGKTCMYIYICILYNKFSKKSLHTTIGYAAVGETKLENKGRPSNDGVEKMIVCGQQIFKHREKHSENTRRQVGKHACKFGATGLSAQPCVATHNDGII